MKSRIVSILGLLLISAQAIAGPVGGGSDSLSSAARSVPELDGGMAFFAVALTAGIVALIRERRNT